MRLTMAWAMGGLALAGCSNNKEASSNSTAASSASKSSDAFIIQCDGTMIGSLTVEAGTGPLRIEKQTRAYRIGVSEGTVERWFEEKNNYVNICAGGCDLMVDKDRIASSTSKVTGPKGGQTDRRLNFETSRLDGSISVVERVSYEVSGGHMTSLEKYNGMCRKVAKPEIRRAF